ncbi:MAG: hypothetical protein HY722_09800 [Planctomycetes bacterium]|nr:hypothetical protein [Planctomycetota bacterium]
MSPASEDLPVDLLEDADGPGGPTPAEVDYWRTLERAGFPNRRVPEGRTSSGEAVLCADAARDKIEVHLAVGPDGAIADIGYRPMTLMGVAAEDTADLLCRLVREAHPHVESIHGIRAEEFARMLGAPAPRVHFRTGAALSSLYIASIRWRVTRGLEQVAGRSVEGETYVGDVLETEDQAEAVRVALNQGLAPLAVRVNEMLMGRAVRELTAEGLASVLVHLARPAVTQRLVEAGCRFTRNFAAHFAGGSA